MNEYAALMTDFSIGAIAYLILALLLQTGFPPFYKPWKFQPDGDALEKDFRENLPFIAALIGLFLAYALTELRLLLVGAGVAAIWIGLRIRQDLLRDAGGPLPWAAPYLPTGWPMLAFDVWTVGLGVAFGFF